jgi:hypothetical protein
MKLIVTYLNDDENDVRRTLTSDFNYNLSYDEVLEKTESVIEDFENNRGVTIDVSGDDNEIDFNLPDGFETESKAKPAFELLQAIEDALK